MLCVLSGIGIGTIIATFTRSQQQAQLMSFFVNPPLSMLSGATDADRSDAGLDAAID